MKYIALLLLLLVNCNLSFAVELPKNAVMAAKIIDLDTGEVLFEHNPNTPLIPASNQKIITTYAALNLLDPKSTFQTSLYTLGNDLYIKFSGDPELTYQDLKGLFDKYSTKLKGKIYIDDLDFDREYFGKGWSHDQIKFCFSSPISAIMIDKNCDIYNVEKKDFKITPEKEPHFTKLVNNAKAETNNEFCELELDYHSKNQYNLTGCYDKNNLPSKLFIAARDPHQIAIDAIKTVFPNNEIIFAPLNVKAKLIATYNSQPLHTMLVDMMVESDNQISESVFKLISKRKLQQGSWKNSTKIVSKFLQDNLNDSNFIIKDGSGASRKNLISPSTLVAILAKEKDNQMFIKTFPQSGMEGTLKNRFMQKPLFENIYAKTGTIDNASALSGYAFLNNNKKIAFSIIINNCINDKVLKKFEEDLLYDVLTKSS